MSKHDAPAPVEEVQHAYATRSAEYAEALGTMEHTHKLDRELVSRWSRECEGPIIDAGCGPGHWTDFLRQQGAEIEGIDLVPDFIDHSRKHFPLTKFRLGSLENLSVPDNSLAGVLCWYSLIHTPPTQIDPPLSEIRRALRPGSQLLLGFFSHPHTETFPHAVTTAYRWSIEELCQKLEATGFVIEETQERADPDTRPHAAIRAKLS